MKIAHIFYRRHLEEGEKIITVAHRHWLVLKLKIWKASSFCIFPSVICLIFFPALWMFWVVWLSVGIVWYFFKALEWYLDCLLITNLGVVDIERRGIFDNVAKRIDYNTIDGISYTIKGFLPTLFNYGDIVIDKMGSGVHINLADAANPRKVEKMIMKYQEQFVEEKSFTDHEVLKDMLADMIAVHAKKYGVKKLKKE